MDKCGLNVVSSESCNVDCVRERMKQRLQSAMRTLRKSITKQQFYIQFSGTEYEVAQKPPKAAEGAETCSTGQVLRDGKCGMFPAERVDWFYCFIRIYGSNLCISSQWAVVWGHFIVGSKSSVSSVPLVHTRTRWDNFPVSHVPVLKDRESLVPRMCPSVEVIPCPIFSSLILRLFPFYNVRKSGKV